MLYETIVMPNLRLTDYQKRVLAIIAGSPDGSVADNDISDGANMTTARDMLSKMGLIQDIGDHRYKVTDAGYSVSNTENITNSDKQLTDVGKQFAYKKEQPTPSGKPTTKSDDISAEVAHAAVSAEVGTPGPSESITHKHPTLIEFLIQ